MRILLLRVVTVAFLLALGGSACLAKTWTVNTINNVFVPADLTILPGDVVRWVWGGGIHTTTSGAGGPDGLWDAPIDMANTSFQYTFNAPGSFPYFCRFHVALGMAGTITVSSNFPPVVQNPGTVHGLEGQYLSVIITATDVNQDTLTLSDIGTTPSWASFVDVGGGKSWFHGTPGAGQSGTFPVSVRAFDGVSADTASFDIVIGATLGVVNLTASGFLPSPVDIPVGGQVKWIKQAGGNHTTTNGTGPLDPAAGTLWDAQLRAATPEFTQSFPNAGTYPYFCRNHPSETGTVIVEDARIGIGEPSAPPLRIVGSPNPFQGGVVLTFDLDKAERATLRIIDLSGRTVLDLFSAELPRGSHRVTWGGWDDHHQPVASGIYFVRLETGDGHALVRKLFKTR
jgi:plastocyanin